MTTTRRRRGRREPECLGVVNAVKFFHVSLARGPVTTFLFGCGYVVVYCVLIGVRNPFEFLNLMQVIPLDRFAPLRIEKRSLQLRLDVLALTVCVVPRMRQLNSINQMSRDRKL